MRVQIVFGVVLTGVIVVCSQEVASAQAVEELGESTEAAQSQSAPPVPPPNPTRRAFPCHFGPITKRITHDEVEAIISASPTRRAAWHAILAREDDETVEPFTFYVAATDDGLGDGLVCLE